MTANATGDGQHRTVLLLLPASEQMFPLSTAALSQAQAPREKLLKDCADAYLLDADGSLCRIEEITVPGPWGSGWARNRVGFKHDEPAAGIDLGAVETLVPANGSGGNDRKCWQVWR